MKLERGCKLFSSTSSPPPHIKQLCQENLSELTKDKLLIKLEFKHRFINDYFSSAYNIMFPLHVRIYVNYL